MCFMCSQMKTPGKAIFFHFVNILSKDRIQKNITHVYLQKVSLSLGIIEVRHLSARFEHLPNSNKCVCKLLKVHLRLITRA